MTMSSRIAVFNKGALQQYASPREIYAEPANEFVANFVGEREMTFLDGAVSGGAAGALRLAAGGAFFDLPGAAVRFPGAAGSNIRLGVRAESVNLVDPSAPGAFPATATQIELSGPDQIVYAKIATGGELCARVPAARAIRSGDGLHLAFAVDAIHMFDPATGASLLGRR